MITILGAGGAIGVELAKLLAASNQPISTKAFLGETEGSSCTVFEKRSGASGICHPVDTSA